MSYNLRPARIWAGGIPSKCLRANQYNYHGIGLAIPNYAIVDEWLLMCAALRQRYFHGFTTYDHCVYEYCTSSLFQIR
jgi:hypothetical protein